MPQQVIAQVGSVDFAARICVAVLALLFFGLSAAITAVRIRERVLYGAPDDPTRLLTKLIRAQGNTAEYVGLISLLILWAGTRSAPGWVVGMMILAVIARVLFAVGMLISPSLAQPNAVRALGAGGTYVAGVGLSLAMLLS